MMGMDLNDEAIEKLLDAAQAHGDDLGSETQIGDLEELCRLIWGVLTPEQRALVWEADTAQDLLKELPGEAE
jgi:hypothetical protein